VTDDVRRRARDRMRAEGIPVGTDDPTLLALGARPLEPHPSDRRFWCRECRPDVDPFVGLLGYCYEHAPVPWHQRAGAALRRFAREWAASVPPRGPQ
jgi:hypothetical protein